MSRIGKQPVAIPAGVEVVLDGREVQVKGKEGELSFGIPDPIEVAINADDKQVVVSRPNDQRATRALHGLVRAVVANMVTGVQKPFEKRLEIVGVGYQAQIANGVLKLSVGFANTIELVVPPKVTCELASATMVVVKSVDKHACGQFAANIRRVRPPEPYKGKGIRYQGEHVRRKEGKAMAGG
ncbi:MAG: 50S ribosomal protein L6 [Planctomycetaceae bacterium]